MSYRFRYYNELPGLLKLIVLLGGSHLVLLGERVRVWRLECRRRR